MPHFAGQLEDHVDEGGPIRPLLAGLRDCLGELLVDNLLNAFKSRGGAQSFLDHFPGLLEGDDTRGELAQAFQALMNRGFADAEVPSGVGLGVAGVEVGAEVGVGDFGASHVRDLSLKQTKLQAEDRIHTLEGVVKPRTAHVASSDYFFSAAAQGRTATPMFIAHRALQAPLAS
jgi:hypothetical protein